MVAGLKGNEPEFYDTKKTESGAEQASSGNSELLKAIESLEWNLSDEGGIVKALLLGCEQLNGTTAPIVSLICAREKLTKIKKLAGF
jgi:hypothetical protein